MIMALPKREDIKNYNFTFEEYVEHTLEQAHEYLDMCQIYGDREEREGLITNIRNSIEAKQWLWDILSKCKGWNGNGQVILPFEEMRGINFNEIDYFDDYLFSLSREEGFLEEMKSNGRTAREIEERRDTIGRWMYLCEISSLTNGDEDSVIINGIPLSDYASERLNLIEELDVLYKCHVVNSMYVTEESYNKYKLARKLRRFLTRNATQFIDDEYEIEYIKNEFGIRLSVGVKTTKAVQKIAKAIGLYDFATRDEGSKRIWNRNYVRYCDAVNPLAMPKWSVISINFVDYLSMCHGHKWTSCLNVDKGGYLTEGRYGTGFNSRRTLDYALDPSTIVFYTVEPTIIENFELAEKNTRQLFHFNGKTLIQSRLYPQGDEARSETYTLYRQIIESVLAEGLDEANMWSAPNKGTISLYDGVVTTPYEYDDNADYIDFLQEACHDGTERDFQSEVNYVIFRGDNGNTSSGGYVEIGSIKAVDIFKNTTIREGWTYAISDNEDYRYNY